MARELDPQGISAAEFARKNHEVVMAIKLAEIALGYTSSPLNLEEITELIADPNQLRILVCLARIHVDSLKSAANQSSDPQEILEYLEQAAQTVWLIYKNEGVKAALQGVNTDPFGGTHHFLPEMARDWAKTVKAAFVLFPEREAELIKVAQKILMDTLKTLPESQPTKPLIKIEAEILSAQSGKPLSAEVMVSSFKALSENDIPGGNFHRVATVASWLEWWGRKTDNSELVTISQPTYNQIISEHPEWSGIKKNTINNFEDDRRKPEIQSQLDTLDQQRLKEMLIKLLPEN